jgi:hypothetical protein
MTKEQKEEMKRIITEVVHKPTSMPLAIIEMKILIIQCEEAAFMEAYESVKKILK